MEDDSYKEDDEDMDKLPGEDEEGDDDSGFVKKKKDPDLDEWDDM